MCHSKINDGLLFCLLCFENINCIRNAALLKKQGKAQWMIRNIKMTQREQGAMKKQKQTDRSNYWNTVSI